MQIFVKSLSGLLAFDVEPSSTIKNVKSKIASRENIDDDDEMMLFFAGQPLNNQSTLEDYSIGHLSTIQLNLRLLGGAKKRKKKNYTTPKKNKHKKKKVKLAVLKYYKVEDDGTITRLRRECENAECGAGIFMANHADRQHCGRCGLTFVFKKPEDK